MFKSGKKKVMLCIKAFGMGSMLISRYSGCKISHDRVCFLIIFKKLQELKKLKRLQGYAIKLDYSPQDQKYSKILHGMSLTIRQWQLKEVLKKISAW